MTRFLAILLLSFSLVGGAMAQDPPQPEALGAGFQWATTGSNVTQITTGARYTLNDWYGQFDIGGYSANDEFEANFFIGATVGRRLALLHRVHLGADFGYRHVMPDGSDNPLVSTEHHFSFGLRLKMELTLNEHIGFFLGTGIDRRYSGYSLGSPKEDTGLFFWGVSLL